MPSVAYLGLDCMPSRAGVLNEISKVFPVSSIGEYLRTTLRNRTGIPDEAGRKAQNNVPGAVYVFATPWKTY